MRKTTFSAIPLTAAIAAALLMQNMTRAQTPSGSAIHDGVVVDAAAGAAYLTSANGTLAAVDLATGTPKWTSATAARPLAVTDSTLVAQGAPDENEELVVLSIDTSRGAEKRRTNVDLPGGLKARLTDSASQRTLVQGLVAGTGHVVVSWAIESRIARGAAPDDTVVQASGATRIDPDTGAAVALPAGTGGDDGALSGLDVAGMMQLRSADGRHTLRSQRAGDPNGRTPYQWTITTATGEVAGVVSAPMSVAPFVVSGSQLLFVAPASGYRNEGRFVHEPLRLQAIDLASGAQLWAVPVLDTKSVLPPP